MNDNMCLHLLLPHTKLQIRAGAITQKKQLNYNYQLL